MSFLKNLIGFGKKEKTREDVVRDIVKRAHQDYLMTIEDMNGAPGLRNLKIDVVLNPKTHGDAAKELHKDLLAGRADDLYAALQKTDLVCVESVLPVRSQNEDITFRVVYDSRPAAERNAERGGPDLA